MQIPRPWLDHYDPGVPASIQYPDQPLFQFLQDAAAKYPDRACTVLDDKAISFRDMNAITDRLALDLAALGVTKGDRVGILMPNVPQFVMAFYAILKAGAVVVAMNPLFTLPEIVNQVNDAGVRILFVTSSLLQSALDVQAQCDLRSLIVADVEDGHAIASGVADSSSGTLRPETTVRPPQGERVLRLASLLEGGPSRNQTGPLVSGDDVALFQYSGGTTGVSKAAVASHRGVVANTMQFRRWLVTLREGQEVMLMAIPLYHAYGMIAGMSLAVALGATLALVPNPRDVQHLLNTIGRYRPTVFPGVPGLYSAISNHPDVQAGRVDLRSIRVCISGSTALLRETKERFEQLSGGTICEGYGLSEAPVVTHCNPLLGQNKVGSIGMPMPDVDCRLVDPDDAEQLVEPGTAGELVLRGPQLMLGYNKMPSETAHALRPLSDGHTWLFTGDIVRMDADGYFYIVDRKKDVIKPGGFQVWPRDVEEVIASYPKVLEVGVAGVPDAEHGESVKAWIVLRHDVEATPEEIRAWCRDKLAVYKIPAQIEFRRELPKSTVGKVLRRELVKQHKEQAAP